MLAFTAYHACRLYILQSGRKGVAQGFICKAQFLPQASLHVGLNTTSNVYDFFKVRMEGKGQSQVINLLQFKEPVPRCHMKVLKSR